MSTQKPCGHHDGPWRCVVRGTHPTGRHYYQSVHAPVPARTRPRNEAVEASLHHYLKGDR